MASGCVDVRLRDDNSRLGKWRIDDLAAHFHTLNPKPAAAHDKFYQKIWKPENYPKQDENALLLDKLEKQLAKT